MTINSIPENDRKERFIATAGQTIFPFDFPIFAATDLQVKRERTGVESTLIFGTDYTVTGAGEQAGGNITLTAGAQLNDIIVLLSAMPSGRTAQYVNGGDLPASALEGDFNRIRILLQQILTRASLLYPQTDGPMPDLPPIVSRAGRFLAFDAQGQPYAAGAPGTALDAVARAGDTMTGPLRIAAGSAAAPGLTPAGDTNSGIFAPAADEIGISLNGQEVARFNSNGLVGRLVPRTWLDVASAATIDLGAQDADSLRVTGTTGISGLGTAPSGTRRRLRFAGVLTITHSGALICPGAANIITAAGDIADVESLGSGNWVVTAFQPAVDVYTRKSYVNDGDRWVQLASANITAVSQIDLTWTGGAYLLYKIYLLGARPSSSTSDDIIMRVRRNGTILSGATDYQSGNTWWLGTSAFTSSAGEDKAAIAVSGVVAEPVFAEIDLLQAASSERILTQQKARWTSNVPSPAHARSIFTTNTSAGSGWLDGARIIFTGSTNFAAVGKIVVLGMKS